MVSGNRPRSAAVLMVIAALASGSARAQEQGVYPAKSVEVIVDWAAGGSVDTMARGMAQAMAAGLGQSFPVVNRDGAAGTIGKSVLAKARADGYTLGFGPINPITNSALLIKGIPYGLDSFEYVCQYFENMFAPAVPLNSPFKSFPELVAHIKANPGKVSYGQLGIGSIAHLSIQNIALRQGLKLVDVPYKGEALMLPDLQSGRLDFGVHSAGGAVGKPFRLLAVFGGRRHAAFPDVPTVAELGLPSFQPGRNGIVAPKGTPPETLRKLEQACAGAVQSESMRTVSQRLHEQIIHRGREAFTESAAQDLRENAELLQALGLIQR